MTGAPDASLRGLDDCGCCQGLAAHTPAETSNRPGLTALAYRIGTHAQFKRSLLARLSASAFPALAGLRTREDDDFSIALLDAWAAVADVLTFYQERIANESYLRTATERLSLLHLARLIGYELRPGVAAGTYLAFTLEEAPGAPSAITLEPGIKVQSVPGPNETPQTFETVQTIEARPAWNALKPRRAQPQPISAGLTQLYLKGTATQLQPGDAILFVGTERATNPSDTANRQRWDLRILRTVEVDPANDRTRVTWGAGLSPTGSAAASGVTVYALRQRAALFGHNAPDPRLVRAPAGMRTGGQWNDFAPPPDRIELDAVYPRVAPGSWVVLAKPDASGSLGARQLYRVNGVSAVSVAAFALSGKVTQIAPDITDDLGSGFGRRETVVFAASEELPLADRPIPSKVGGTGVLLAAAAEGLGPGRMLAVSGKETETGPTVSELVELARVEAVGGLTRLHFGVALQRQYLRHTVTINANVARATQGETVHEVLGGGDAGQPYQAFPLRQSPLTHVGAPTPSGAQSTLQVRVNDLLWHEVPTLLGRGPHDHVYVTRNDGEGRTTVQFGDGATGARLPSGRDNVRATYRKGMGRAGLVQAGQLTLLMTRPLGLKEVTNPQAAAGAEAREAVETARRNAPLTVRTLDRVVSLQDYEDFARAFGGIAKAMAAWTWGPHGRDVFLTVAGPDGAAVLPTGDLYRNLLAALRRAGDPRVRLRVASYRPAPFRIAGKLRVDPDHLPQKVLAAAEASLRARFGFDERAFGQPVLLGEVIAALQGVPGVVAVDVDALHRTDQAPALTPRLTAALPEPAPDGAPAAAELLTLDPGPLTQLGVLP